MCDCLARQRRSGSVVGVRARFPHHCVRIEARAQGCTRTADSGDAITFSFCTECGGTVHYVLEPFPEAIVIPVRAFADRAFPPPRLSVYESRRRVWAQSPPGAQHLD